MHVRNAHLLCSDGDSASARASEASIALSTDERRATQLGLLQASLSAEPGGVHGVAAVQHLSGMHFVMVRVSI
jgi:hypothetical protein